MHIYCSAGDRHPLKFVDITELMFRQLPRRGIRQTWYVQASGQASGLRIDDSVPGIRVVVPPFMTRWGLLGKLLSKLTYWTLDTVLLLAQLRTPIDAILIRDKYWASLVGWMVARIRRIPYLIWMSYPYPEHDLERSRSVSGPLRYMLIASGHLGRLTFYRFAMNRADHVYVQSERMRLDMHERFSIPLQRMTAVPMGVGDQFLHPERIDPLPRADGAPTVLYLGGLEVVRRLEIMIEAFAAILARRPDVRFRIVGSGTGPDDRARLEQRARELGILGQIEFTGQLPLAEAMRHVIAADVCLSPIAVTPTLRVASPTKFVEYLALGRPTVGNDHPEQSMIAELSHGAMTVDWSADGFAQATLWCLNHPEQARAMAARGQAWVREHRTYERIGDEVARSLRLFIERNSHADPAPRAA